MIQFQQSAETFFVFEELFYEPSGEGAYVFVKVRKQDLSTFRAKRVLSEIAGVPVREIHHAGMKDTLATAEQWLSWRADLQRSSLQDGAGVTVLEETRHSNNLKIGHVRSNRFRLVFSKAAEDAFPDRDAARLQFPNLYGRQRFGRGEYSLEALKAALQTRLRRSEIISGMQSFLFNSMVQARVARFGRELMDDDLYTLNNGKNVFEAGEDTTIPTRFETGEITPTVAMPGYKIRLTAWEKEHLNQIGINPEDFRSWGKSAKGTRRPLWVHPTIQAHKVEETRAELAFRLPSGAYATIYLLALFHADTLHKNHTEWADFSFITDLGGHEP